MHLLIVEDDLDLGAGLLAALKADGFSGEWYRRIADAPRALSGAGYDAVLLDLTLPDGSGMDLLHCWRQAGVLLPIIVITARSALSDRLAGLDGGADDFVVKPFAMEELVARTRAVLRRAARQASERWMIGDLCIEPRGCRAALAGEVLDLSPREFQILVELAREPGQVLAKSVLARRLEPLGDPVEFGVIEVHISNLRRKIGAERIRTVRGVGYAIQT